MKSLKFRVELDLMFERSGYCDTPPEDLEPDYSLDEIDTFMNEPLYLDTNKNDGSKLPRFYYYAQSVAGFLSLYKKNNENSISNIDYSPGGKLSFDIELLGKNLEQRGFDLADDLREKGLGNSDGWSPYEGGIGNEFVVPSRKKYRDMEWEESSSDSDDESEAGEASEESDSSEESEEGDYQAIGHIDFREDNRIRVTRID